MENTTSSNSKLFKVGVVVLIVMINLLMWGIFWINSENEPAQIAQPPANPLVIPIAVEADHPAVSALTINYTYIGEIQSLKQTDNEGIPVYELVLKANNEVVPQTFFIPEDNDITIIQQVGGNIPITVSELQARVTVEITTVFDVKNDTSTIVSITRTQ